MLRDHQVGAGQIHGAHQLAQRHQRTEAIFADRKGDRPTRGQRRHAHDHADDNEHAVAERFEEIDHRLGAPAHVRQGDAEQGGKHEDLQDVVLGQRVDHADGHHVQHEVDKAVRGLGGRRRITGDAAGIERGGIDIHAHARLGDIHHQQAQQQRQGRHHFKIDQRTGADAAQFLHAFHLGDAQHHHGENHRREHHLDQANEAVAQGFEVGAERR